MRIYFFIAFPTFFFHVSFATWLLTVYHHWSGLRTKLRTSCSSCCFTAFSCCSEASGVKPNFNKKVYPGKWWFGRPSFPFWEGICSGAIMLNLRSVHLLFGYHPPAKKKKTKKPCESFEVRKKKNKCLSRSECSLAQDDVELLPLLGACLCSFWR